MHHPAQADLRSSSIPDISPIWLGVWLSVVLVLAKFFALDGNHRDAWLFNLPTVSFSDVLFAISAGLLGELLARATRRQPRVSRAIRRTAFVLFAICAWYGVIATGVFQYFGRPLTFDLLKLVKTAAAVKSSITSQLTVPLAIAIVGVPGGYYALGGWASRRRSFPTFTLCFCGAWISLGWYYLGHRPQDFQMLQLWKSPHAELARSVWTGIVGRDKPRLPKEFPAEYKDEFRTFAERQPPVLAFQPANGVARPKNVIVIVLESVGTKYLSLYGSPYPTTPGLESEAKNALVFDHFYAHVPYTFCSFMALNFSIYPGMPWSYVPGEAYSDQSGRALPMTMARMMKEHGARTAYLHNGDLEWGGMDYVLKDQGYDVLKDYRSMNCPQLSSWGAEDKYLVDSLIGWIDEKPDQPFFAFCWTDQTHDPYFLGPDTETVDLFNGQPPKNNRRDLSQYLNVVRQTDAHLKRLFDALRARGLADDTLVVITGDHGEAFRDPHDQRGHGFTIFQEDVNVPLILWNPRLFAEGRRVSTIGAHVDVNVTIADIMGWQPSMEWQGHSLFAPERPERAYFLASIGDYVFGLRDGRWKYSYTATTGSERLHDLTQDPREQTDVSAAHGDVTKQMRERLAAWVAYEEEFLRPGAK